MPPRGVTSPKQKRQYEHIKDSELQEGRSPRRATQIAAATINKQRAAAGQTKSSGRKASGGGRKKAATGGRKKSAAGGRKTAARTSSRKTTGSRKAGGSRTGTTRRTSTKKK
jgi:hypothetical protein